jgi:hypothetical protein
VFASSARDLSRHWNDRLAPYRRHRHVEHLEALVDEAIRYVGIRLENDLAASSYWSKAPLSRRVAVLLFLVDRGVVERSVRQGRRVYVPTDTAEDWVSSQTSLAPYLGPTLELVAALRNTLSCRIKPSQS